MPEKRKTTHITNKEDIDYFLSIKEEDITASFIMNNFGEFDGKSKFHTYDTIDIPPNSFGPEGKRNKNTFTTTLGIWVFNKYFIEKDLFDIVGYINKSITKKVYKKIDQSLAYAMLEDKIDSEVMKKWIIKCQFFMQFVSVLSPNHTLNMLTISKTIDKKKQELIKKYKKELDAGNEVIAHQMETELLDYARELLKDDPSMDMYDSGARGSFDNNFKNMFVMKGAIKDPNPLADKKFNIATSSYMDGITKDEYNLFANSLAEGPYFRAKKTEVGGYWEKLFLSAFQHIILGPEDSDCGTTRHIKVKVTDSNINDIMYCYVIENDGSLTEITSENKDKFIGTTVKLRFSSMCESRNGICNKCAGNLFYRLGIKNIGTAIPQVASRLKVISLKGFHDSTVKITEMDPMKAFGIE